MLIEAQFWAKNLKNVPDIREDMGALDLPVLRYYCDSENDSGNMIVKDSI